MILYFTYNIENFYRKKILKTFLINEWRNYHYKFRRIETKQR